MIPKDPVMLLSYLNTQLRDYYPSLDDLCGSIQIEPETLVNQLATIDYYYDQKLNQFI